MARPASAVLVLWLCSAAAVGAQESPRVLTGRVVSEVGAAVVAAEVRVVGGDATLTDEEGRFRLVVRIPPPYRVELGRIGFVPQSRSVGAPAEGSAELEIVMRRTILSIPGIEVATSMGEALRAPARGMLQLAERSLEREAAGTLAQTLRQQPGISVRSMGPAASMPVIRGLTGDRILVLQDGQRAADLAGSADDHAVTIDPLSARRVEVIRGPATILYGNNAAGGVVNVISGDLPGAPPARPEWSLGMQTESAHPGGAAALRGAVPLGGVWSMALRGSTRAAGDVRIPPDPRLGGRIENTSSDASSVSVGLGREGTALATAVAANGYRFSYGLPVPPGTDPVRLRGRRQGLSGRLESSVPRAIIRSARLEASAQDYRHDELGGTGSVDQSFRQRTATGRLVLEQGALGPFARGAWGASLLVKSYGATGPAALVPPALSRGYGLFGMQEMGSAEGARVQLGARMDHYAIGSAATAKFGAARERTFGALSGSVGLTLPVGGGLSLGAHLARGFRAPTVEELFSGAPHAGTGSVELGDPQLAPERSLSGEGLLQLRRPRLQGQLSMFLNRVDGYVHLREVGDTLVDGARLPVLLHAQGEVTLAGAEMQAEWGAGGGWTIGVIADYLRARHSDGTPLSYMPPPRAGLLARWERGPLSVGADLHHETPQRRVGAAGEDPVPAFTDARIHLGIRVRRGGMLHSLQLRGENLRNVERREATSRTRDFAPSPGRNLSLGYRVHF